MGVDAGFDMVPRLSRGVVDKFNWDRFIQIVKARYKDDERVKIHPKYIVFEAGEHPKLPLEGHKFLRFSSKISGAGNVNLYIREIASVAKAIFGYRVSSWHEGADQHGHYNWTEVHESVRSYAEPDEPEESTGITPSLTGVDHSQELDVPIFEVKEVPGKGKGLIARLNIPKGSRILSEKPWFTVQPMSPAALHLAVSAKLQCMSKDEQRQFLSLHNNFPGKLAFSGIVRTNALPCGSGSSVGGVYPTISLINHSCLPNAHNNWNPNAEHETIHAVRPIQAGEEITIRYDRGGPLAARQAFLRKSFGFDCHCSACSLGTQELQASDSRQVLIQQLDEAIGDWSRPAEESLQDCQSLLHVLREEFGPHTEVHDARLYYDAFQICIAHGDQARASVLAERAYKARVVCEGEDSPVTQKVKLFSSSPADHYSFELYSQRWKRERKMIPKGLDTVSFNKWLFEVHDEKCSE